MFFGPLIIYVDKMLRTYLRKLDAVLHVLVWYLAYSKHIYLLYFLSFNLKIYITIKNTKTLWLHDFPPSDLKWYIHYSSIKKLSSQIIHQYFNIKINESIN
jgi:hypothetical protein